VTLGPRQAHQPKMKKVLVLAAVSEAATGVALLVVPSLVGRLLLGEELTDVAIPVARVTGIALIALGVACWPGPPRVGMLTYSAAVTLYLAFVGIGGKAGILLWPAVVAHAGLSILLSWALWRAQGTDLALMRGGRRSTFREVEIGFKDSSSAGPQRPERHTP